MHRAAESDVLPSDPVPAIIELLAVHDDGLAGEQRNAAMTRAGMDEAEVRGLLQQVRDGRRSALDDLLARHRGYLLDMVRLRMDQKMCARIDPSDVVQEAQMEAARRIDDYLGRQPMPFHIWLRKTAYENLLRLRRQHIEADRRSINKETPLPDTSSAMLAAKIFSHEPDAAHQAARDEAARRLRQAITELPEIDSEILLMRTLEGLTNHEVAQVLGIEPDASSKRYGRAILRLRRILFDQKHGDSTK